MNSNRKIARIAGVLFIIATVTVLVSQLFLGSISPSDYLSNISAHQNQVILGALFQVIAAFACAGIAISLYPVLRKYHEGLALGSVCFRTIEAMLYLIVVIVIGSLLSLSLEFVTTGASDASYFHILGASLLSVRDGATLLAVIAFSLGALMYYAIFYQSKLIPRWLSGWGVIGVILCLAASMFVLFRLIDLLSTVQVVLSLPIAVQEMVLAVWLIVRGFNSSAIVSLSAKTELAAIK
jgi:uncharacterized protein DUF4386